jgi:hypothetical protein
MKTSGMFFLLLGLGSFLSCTKETSSPIENPVAVSVVFEAKYTGTVTNGGIKGSSDCGPDFRRVAELAYGKGTYVGFSTFNANFCFSNLELKPGLSYIETSKGDKLYISYSGKTCEGLGEDEDEASEPPDEICCWDMPFTILGGTGIFEGAAGEGVTDDYFGEGNVFYHSWKGNLILPKARLKDMQQ